MAFINIEVGRTSTPDFRYIGIQPPLDMTGQYQAVTEALGEDELNLGFKARIPRSGYCYDLGTHMDTGGDIDVTIIEIANKIAGVLRSLGDVVNVNEELRDISCGRHFFENNILTD